MNGSIIDWNTILDFSNALRKPGEVYDPDVVSRSKIARSKPKKPLLQSGAFGNVTRWSISLLH